MEETFETRILELRGARVILDSDLARAYGVGTKVLNQAVKRNLDRFQGDFAFQLNENDAEFLRSQIVTSKSLDLELNKENRGGRRNQPWAFTEHGVLMAANVLRGPQAIEMSIYLVRAFVRLREQMSANQAILKRLVEIDRQLMQHDGSLRDLYRKILPLLQPENEKASPKGRRGFQKPSD